MVNEKNLLHLQSHQSGGRKVTAFFCARLLLSQSSSSKLTSTFRKKKSCSPFGARVNRGEKKIPPKTLTPFVCVVWGVGEAFYGKTSLFIWQLLLRRAAKNFSSSSLFRSVCGLLLYLEEEVVLFSRQGQSGQRRVRRKHRTGPRRRDHTRV